MHLQAPKSVTRLGAVGKMLHDLHLCTDKSMTIAYCTQHPYIYHKRINIDKGLEYPFQDSKFHETLLAALLKLL